MSAQHLIAWQGELEFLSATWNDKDGNMVQFRIVRTPEDDEGPHPFRQFTKRRGNRAGTRFTLTFAVVGSEVVREVEVMLADWMENAGGRTLKFWVPEDGSTHPFAGYKRPSMKEAGDRLMCGFVELADDDEPVDQEARAKVERAGQKLSQVAALMCRQDSFLRFLKETVKTTRAITWNEKYAAMYVRKTCGVVSRSDLDHNAEAAERFHALIRRPYTEYQNVR